MTSISIDFRYQSILIGGLNRLISMISTDFRYWFLSINYVWGIMYSIKGPVAFKRNWSSSPVGKWNKKRFAFTNSIYQSDWKADVSIANALWLKQVWSFYFTNSCALYSTFMYDNLETSACGFYLQRAINFISKCGGIEPCFKLHGPVKRRCDFF